MSSRLISHATIALGTLLCAACHADTTAPIAPSVTPPERPVPPAPADYTYSLRVVVGGAASDTVRARFAQALVVEVRRGGGQPVSGIVVRFDARPPADTLRASM